MSLGQTKAPVGNFLYLDGVLKKVVQGRIIRFLQREQIARSEVWEINMS